MKFDKLTIKQRIALKELLKNKYREILFDGGSRAGKTFLVCMFFIMLCIQYPGIRLLMARLRFAHAKASLWLQTLLPMLQYCFANVVSDINHSDYIVKIGQSEIWLGGLDDKERTDKILGQEYAGVFLNEAVRIAESTRNKVRTRLSQKIDNFVNFVIYDCNPGHPLHYLYQQFYINKNSNQLKIHWMPDDNRENLSTSYIEDFLDSLKGHEKARFRDGKWVALPGAVYPNVNDENIIDFDIKINDYDNIIAGLDFGLYTAFNIWRIDDENKKAYCLYEFALHGSSETVTKNIIKELKNIWGIKEFMIPIYCDHEPDRIYELQEAGFNALKAHKDVEPGDATVNEYELYFHLTCSNTFQSMLNLVHQTDANDNFILKHLKENDHEADAARYTLHGFKKDGGDHKPIFTKGLY